MHVALLKQSRSHVRGTGLALLLHRKWAQHYRPLPNPNPLMHLVAIKLQPPAVPHDLIVANCYIPPVGSPQFRDMSMLDWYQQLTMFCSQVLGSQEAALLAVGDFNAAVSFHDPEPAVGSNESGRLLVDLAYNCELAFALKYTADTSPSYVTHRGGTLVTSCPDHVLVSEGLAQLTLASVKLDVIGSDHRAIDVCMTWPNAVCSDQPIPLQPHFPILRWKGYSQAYALELHRRITRGDLDAMRDALVDGAIDAAMDSFAEVIMFSAIASGHDMLRPHTHPHLPKPVAHKPWFDASCKLSRQHYLTTLRRLGNAHPDAMLAAKNYHTLRRHKQRQWAKDTVGDLIQQAIHQPKSFWKNFKSSRTSSPVASCAADVHTCMQYMTDLLHKPHLPNTAHPPGMISDHPDHALNAPFSAEEIHATISSLRNNVAAGVDGIPAEFYKYAVLTDNRGIVLEHLLVDYLVTLFNCFFNKGSLPQKWGTSLLTMLYKKGDKANWANYRPLAVTLVIAKVYGLVLNARLSKWAEANHVHCPAQVGFRPGHSTVFNNFVLQHFAQKHKQLRKPLFVCFLDISKAYDSVLRAQVWQRLHHLGVRGRMLFALSALYHHVSYIVKFQNGTTVPFACNLGVRQGCPVSPFLFSVIIEQLHGVLLEDCPTAGPAFQVPVVGQSSHVPCLMFADDSAGMEDSGVRTQMALHSVHRFCLRHEFDLSLSKTKVLVFNASFQTAVDRSIVFKFGGNVVQRTKEHVFLGLLTKQKNIVAGMLQSAAQRGQAALALVYRKMHAHGARANAHVTLRLFEAVVIPNLTFGCEVWGPWILHIAGAASHDTWIHGFHEHPTQNVVDQVRMSFARTLLGLTSSTPVWNILRELGWYPLQVYVARQLVRFMNRLWDMPAATLARRAMLESWHSYFDGCTDGWCARVHTFLTAAGIPACTYLQEDQRIPIYDDRQVLTMLRQLCHQVYLSPGLPSKLAGYHTDFAMPLHDRADRFGWQRALHFDLPVSLQKLKLLTRFRLSCHHLAVETGRWVHVDIDHRTCQLCGLGAVQDEHHVMFACPALQPARNKFPLLFTGRFTHVRQLMDFSAMHDWRAVARDLCRFLHDVGGIYSPLLAPDD